MSETIKGKVNILTAYNPKFKNAGMKIAGRDEWIRVDKDTAEKVRKGQVIAIKVKETDRGDLKQVGPVSIKPGSGGAGGGGGGYGGDDSRSAAIQYQHSQEMAIQTAGLLLGNGAFKLGAANKPQERNKQIIALIDDLTAKFANDVTTLAALKKAKETAEDLGDDEAEDDDAPAAEEGEESGDDDEVTWDED